MRSTYSPPATLAAVPLPASLAAVIAAGGAAGATPALVYVRAGDDYTLIWAGTDWSARYDSATRSAVFEPAAVR